MSIFLNYFFLFFIYSIIGWIVETTYIAIRYKRWVDRGFLIGPYCPIYGVGSLGIILYLTQYKENILTVFILGMVICSVLEYFTSYIMEKLFNARWWDYSNRKFNINGRVCLLNGIYFGLCGLLVILITNPMLLDFLSNIPNNVLNVLAIIFTVIFFIDVTISSIIIMSFRNTTSKVTADNTAVITSMVREILTSKTFLHRRLLNAFPNLEAGIKKLNEKVNQMEREIKKLKLQKDKLTQETEALIKNKAELLKEKFETLKEYADITETVNKIKAKKFYIKKKKK